VVCDYDYVGCLLSFTFVHAPTLDPRRGARGAHAPYPYSGRSAPCQRQQQSAQPAPPTLNPAHRGHQRRPSPGILSIPRIPPHPPAPPRIPPAYHISPYVHVSHDPGASRSESSLQKVSGWCPIASLVMTSSLSFEEAVDKLHVANADAARPATSASAGLTSETARPPGRCFSLCWLSPVFTPSPHSCCSLSLLELGLTPSLDSRC